MLQKNFAHQLLSGKVSCPARRGFRVGNASIWVIAQNGKSGDPTGNIQQIKVTSGGTLHAAEWLDKIYSSVIDAGTHKAQSIKIAEASKVIENIKT